MIERRRDGWRLLVLDEHAALADELVPIALSERAALERSERVLRDDYRSFVGVTRVAGRRIVAKSSRLKNRDPWIRLTTLVRPGEALDALGQLEEARRAGVPVAEPIAATERRALGMVVDSWLFCGYVDGTVCRREQYREVVGALQRLHDAGWIHGDPHIENFIWDGTAVTMIDCRPRRAGPFAALARAYDFVLLQNNRSEMVRHFPFPTDRPAYRLAKAYDRWVKLWRRVKRAARRQIGLPRNGG